MSSFEILAATSIRARNLPLTWAMIVMVSDTNFASSYVGHASYETVPSCPSTDQISSVICGAIGFNNLTNPSAYSRGMLVALYDSLMKIII